MLVGGVEWLSDPDVVLASFPTVMQESVDVAELERGRLVRDAIRKR
jgi:hypothetical protein